MRNSGRAGLAVLMAVLLAVGLRAGERPPVARGPASVPKAVEYREALLKDVPESWWTEYPAVCLYSGLTEVVAEDGTAEDVYHTLVRLNNQAAVEEQGECRLYFQPEYQTVTLNEARVHTRRGQTLDVRPEHIQVRDANTDYQVYATTREVVLSFPGLGVGDVIELQWTTKGKDIEYAPHYCLDYYFNDVDLDAAELGETHAYPIRRAELAIQLPRQKPLTYASRGRKIEPVVREEGAVRTYRWTTQDVMPPPEAHPAPRKEDFLVGVTASTFSSWDAVAQWELDLRKGCRECTAELRDEIKHVTKDSMSVLDRVRNICRWVRSDLRYLSHGHGAYGNKPHRPAEVLANRFGDCKDKCQLLSVLFEELQVPHEFVVLLTAGSPELHPDVPSPIADHIFLKVDIEGTTHWIDPTGTFDAWDQMREDCSGRRAFLFNARGGRVERLPHLPPDDWRIVSESELQVDTAGNGTLSVRREYFRLAAGRMRTAWMSLPSRRRRETLLTEFSSHYSRARVESLELDEKNLANPDEPLRFEFKVGLPELFPQDEGATTRAGRLYDTPLWDLLLSYRPDVDRQAALQLPQPFHVQHGLKVKLPPTLEFATLPKKESHDTKWGHAELEVVPSEDDPHQTSLHWDVSISQPFVAPGDLAEWLKFDDGVMELYSPGLVLDITMSAEDEQPIREHLSNHSRDAAAWIALVNLLLDLTRHDDARKALQKGRAAVPDDQKLAELGVELAETDEALEPVLRDLHKRWPKEERYAVSLGVALIALGKLDEAEEILEAQSNSNNVEMQLRAMVSLADLRLKQMKTSEAQALLEEAVGLDEGVVDFRSYQHVQGRLFEQQKAWDDAREHYEAALQTFPADADLLAGMIRTAQELKDRPAAIKALWSLVPAAKTAGQLEQAAQFSLQLDRREDAELLAKQALELKPDSKIAAEVLKGARKK